MPIYTTYFNNKNLPKNHIKINISRRPLYPCDYDIDYFKPSEILLQGYKKGDFTQEVFIKLFEKQLVKIPEECLNAVIGGITYLEITYDNVLLICHEKPEDFCHRHLVKEYLNTLYDDLNIKELQSNICSLRKD